MVGFKQRGLRNNNPFNIRRSSCNWIGKVPFKDNNDSSFERFSCMYYGIRAGMLLLRNYVHKGFNTPRKIIERFAPRCENATSAYLSYIVRDSANNLFIGPDDVIGSMLVLCRLASRMVQYENALTTISLCNIGCSSKQLLVLCYDCNIKL